MFMETPQTLIYLTGGAFFLGWVVAKFGSWLGGKSRTRKRDPRDDRIRSLEAEHRVAKNDAEKAKAQLDALKKELVEHKETIERRERSLEEQAQKLEDVRKDLTDSVKKTRELRSELSERATENVRSEVKLREVETELSIAQASTDLIATGVLDYSVAPEKEEEEEEAKTAKAGS